MEKWEKESDGFVGDPQHKSFLFTLLRKVSSHINPQEPQTEEEGENTVVEDETPSPPVPYEKTFAPAPLVRYFDRWRQEKAVRQDSSTRIESFLTEPFPDTMLLKSIFATLEREAKFALSGYDLLLEHYAAEQQTRKDESSEAVESLPPPVLDGEALLFPAADWSAAWCMVLPPLGDGAPVSEVSLREQLQQKGICFGILEENISRLLAPENAFSLLPIAHGVPPIQGEDGKVIEHFPHDIGSQHLVEDEQGTVDFKDLHWLVPIEGGTVICDVVEPTKGMVGTDIRKRPLPAASGKKPKLPMGENVGFNEDKTALIAKARGQIVYENGKYHVKNTIIIPGNVDLSTGNLDVKGNLVIRGNVIAGFSVRASGDITIEGCVEASQVSADGNIIVCQGMAGNMVGSLVAGKDVHCKYLENVHIHAGGDVHTDSIVNCDVSCLGNVYVTSGRGVIIGGTISAMQGIFARIIGNKAGRITVATIGPTEQFLATKNQVEKELEAVEHEVRLLPLANDPEVNLGDRSGLDAAVLRMKENMLKKKMEEILAREKRVTQGQIQADVIYPIAQVSINGATRAVTEVFRMCRLYWDSTTNTVSIGQK